MAGKLPWFKFWVDAYLADERLRMCSLEARGFWADLRCLMHKGVRRGYLQQASGKPLTLQQLARVARCSSEEASRLLRELVDSGAASVSDTGVVYDPVMVREEHKRHLCSRAGKKGGGNPAFIGHPKGVPKGVPKGASNLSSSPELLDDSSPTEGGVRGGGPASQPSLPLHPVGFAEFWEAYPLKAGEDEALAEWRSLAPDPTLRQEILAAVGRQNRWPAWAGGYVMEPARWLHGRRWRDQEPPPRNGQAGKKGTAVDHVDRLTGSKECPGSANG
jgi:hypothetical protein